MRFLRTPHTFLDWKFNAKKPQQEFGSKLKRLFILAGVPDGHAHRFRDTFSVGLLLPGVPTERVSILLGRQSVRITDKHYAPWFVSVRNSWRPMFGALGS